MFVGHGPDETTAGHIGVMGSFVRACDEMHP